MPRRASGGPVLAGSTYLVGEQGPELVTMGRSGHVTPNGGGSGGSAGGAPITLNVIAMDEIERAMITRLQRRGLRGQYAGG